MFQGSDMNSSPFLPQDHVRITIDGNRNEFIPYCATSRSVSLGATPVGGPFASSVNLDGAPFQFGEDHSGQFSADNMKRQAYWSQLMQTFGLAESP